MEKIIVLTMCAFLGFAFSAEVDRGTTRKVAESNYYQNKPSDHLHEFKVKKLDIISSEQNESLLHVFNLSPHGFVIVSTDNRTTPILGYSYKSSFKLENMPKSLTYIFDGYKNDISYLRSTDIKQSTKLASRRLCSYKILNLCVYYPF